MSADDNERDYAVGYSKPPQHTRFVKGQSGNPRGGRPPGAKNMKTLLTKALNELVVVTDNGGRRKLSKREAIITLKLTRFRGARQAFNGGFSDAQDASALFT